MSIDIKQVARRAHVSIATVSRVLNDSGHVRDATRQKVLAAVRLLGYRKNMTAMNLRTRRSRFVGLILPDISNEFFAMLAKSVEQTLRENNFSLFLCNTDEDELKESFYIESLLANQVSGIILASVGAQRHKRLLTGSVPVVFVDRISDGFDLDNCVYIESDNYQGGAIAARLLVEKGARRLALVRDQRDLYHMNQRERGFIDILEKTGIPGLTVAIRSIPVSSASAFQSIANIYRELAFDGLFCGTDSIALGAIKGLAAMGIDIPGKVQIIGFDGIDSGEYISPPLTTIRHDVSSMGISAARSIITMVDEKPYHDHIVLPVELVIRGSTVT